MKYRPEIDGLRAIAVLSVLVYHAKFVLASGTLVSGGFLGVDIFFVISGFLITKILLQSIRAGEFSYLDFYERRARRILPALFVVMLASAPVAWQLMLPDQLIEYAHSILGALLFSSNFVFLAQDSYTAEPSALKPFLHTWSLGIEEQFYIVLPIVLLLIVRRFKASSTLIITIIALLSSLLFAQLIAKLYPDANFFLLSSRAWELLAGSVVAFVELDYAKRLGQKYYAGAVSAMALAIILVSLFAFDETTLHPSLLTAFPVFACAILITFADGPHWVNRVLSAGVLVKIGLISYSLYLWHFPLFAFYRLHMGEPSLTNKFGLLAISLFLATLSYWWIEKPFRNRMTMPLKRTMVTLGTLFLAIAAFQISIIHKQGFSSRLGSVETYITEAQPIRLANGASPDMALNPLVALGDSHAGMLSHALAEYAQQLTRPFIQIVLDGCPLVEGMSLYTDGKHVPRCENIVEDRFDVTRHFKDGIYFYSGRFPLYLSGTRFAEEPGYPVLLTNRDDQTPAPDAVLAATIKTIQHLLDNDVKLVLVYPIPEMGFDVPKRFSKRFQQVPALALKRMLKTEPLSIKQQAYIERAGSVIKAFDSIPDHTKLVRLKPSETLCDGLLCYAHNSEILYYYDDNHLSPKATQLVIESIVPELQRRGWIE